MLRIKEAEDKLRRDKIVLEELTLKSTNELKESEEKHKSLYNNSPIPYQSLDKNGNFIDVNPKFLSTLGYHRDEVIGKWFGDFLHPDNKDSFKKNFSVLKQCGFTHDVLLKFQHKDKYYLDILLEGRSDYHSDGSFKQTYCVFKNITEKKRAEEKLLKNQYYLTKAQEMGIIGTWELDMIKNKLIWTDETYKIFGIPLGTEMNYDLFLNCIHPEDRDYVHEKWSAGLNHEPYDIEHRLIINDKVKWVREKADIEFNSKGKPLKAIGFTQDITERKNAEDLIKESNANLTSLIENRKDSIWSVDKELNYIIFNSSFAKEFLSAYNIEIRKGMNSIDILTQELQKFWKQKYEAVLAGEHIVFEFSQYFRGQDHYYQVSLNPIIEDDRITGVSAISMEVTELKQSKEAIIKEKEFSDKLLESANVIILTLNEKANITTFNKFSEKLTGYKKEEVLGKNWFDLFIPKQNKQEISEVFSKVLKEIPEVSSLENPILCKNGSEKLISWENTVLKDPNGKIIGVLSIGLDITERKKILKNLEQSETKFRLLADYTFNWEYWVDNKGEYIYISPACEKVSGYTSSQFKENPNLFFEIIHPDYREEVQKHFKVELGKKHFDLSIQFIISRADGESRWIEHNCNPVFDNEGNHLGRRGVNRDITEFKKSNQRLVRLSQPINDSKEVVFMTDENGVFTFVNPRFTQLYGYKAEEIIGIETPRILNSGQSTPEEHKKFWDKLLMKNHLTVQYVNKCKDGKLIDIEASADPILDDSGKIIGFLAIQRDISERIKAEKTLRQSKIFLENVLDTTPSGVFTVDTKKRITSWNKMAESITGFTADDLIGKYCDILESDTCSKSCALFDDTIKKPGLYKSCLIKAKNGKEINTLKNYDELRSPEGEVIGGIESFIDITKQTKSEQIQKVVLNIANATQFAVNLEETMQIIQKELGRLMDTQNFFVAMYDEETDNIYLPYFQDEKDDIDSFPAGKTLTGLVIKQGRSFLINDAEAKKLEKEGKIEKVGFDSKIWLGVPLKIKGKVTGAFVLQSYSNPDAYTEKDKEVLEIISNQISISIERKKAEEELKAAYIRATESDRLKSAFLATMSHELRTPLNAIIGFSDLINSDLPSEEITGFAQNINSSGNHLLTIVEDLFDITLIESGQTKIFKEDFKLLPILYDVQKIIKIEQKRTYKNHLDLNLIIPPEGKDIVINTDQPKLKQILINLLKNSLKFTDEGYIKFGYNIEIQDGRQMLKFYVEDTGIGIPKNQYDFIFDIFRQVDDTHMRQHGGIGIGLSISKKLTNLLGGKIWFKSKEDEGTTFYFIIPYEENKVGGNTNETGIETEIEVGTKKKSKLKKKTVLIVEDVESSFEYLEVVLEKSGFNTIWSKNGKTAIEYCNKNPDIDIVLMDINMPVMNGYEATKEIKKIRPELPIIAQTAYAVAGDMEKSLEAGCDDYISKPIKKEVLLEKIEKFLGK